MKIIASARNTMTSGGYSPISIVPQFGYFDGPYGPDDIQLFKECYRGTNRQ